MAQRALGGLLRIVVLGQFCVAQVAGLGFTCEAESVIIDMAVETDAMHLVRRSVALRMALPAALTHRQQVPRVRIVAAHAQLVPLGYVLPGQGRL